MDEKRKLARYLAFQYPYIEDGGRSGYAPYQRLEMMVRLYHTGSSTQLMILLPSRPKPTRTSHGPSEALGKVGANVTAPTNLSSTLKSRSWWRVVRWTRIPRCVPFLFFLHARSRLKDLSYEIIEGGARIDAVGTRPMARARRMRKRRKRRRRRSYRM